MIASSGQESPQTAKFSVALWLLSVEIFDKFKFDFHQLNYLVTFPFLIEPTLFSMFISVCFLQKLHLHPYQSHYHISVNDAIASFYDLQLDIMIICSFISRSIWTTLQYDNCQLRFRLRPTLRSGFKKHFNLFSLRIRGANIIFLKMNWLLDMKWVNYKLKTSTPYKWPSTPWQWRIPSSDTALNLMSDCAPCDVQFSRKSWSIFSLVGLIM